MTGICNIAINNTIQRFADVALMQKKDVAEKIFNVTKQMLYGYEKRGWMVRCSPCGDVKIMKPEMVVAEGNINAGVSA